MMKYILIYLLLVNIFGLLVMGMDKSRARKRKWRIPEKTLFLVSAIGGSVGTLTGMYLFHHKTRHWYFVIGMPLILIIQLACLVYFRFYFKI